MRIGKLITVGTFAFGAYKKWKRHQAGGAQSPKSTAKPAKRKRA